MTGGNGHGGKIKNDQESLEEKIIKAEERVVRTGKTYNDACEELEDLRRKMKAIENDELIAAFVKSNKTLEEAIAFFESDMNAEEDAPKPARRRGRRRKVTT